MHWLRRSRQAVAPQVSRCRICHGLLERIAQKNAGQNDDGAGLPPGNDQEYPVTVPSGSVPDPEKNTDRPAKMITKPEGLSIDPVGGTSGGASDPSAWT